MITIHYKRLSFYLFFLLCISAHAQDLQQNLDSFTGKFITAIRNQDRPQAYLVTDKSIYKPGENIWFRGFLLNSVSQKVTSRNKYLFVDLVNDRDSVISIIVLDAAAQQLNGQLMLPASISPGYYWLRAYTKQVAEGDSSNCFVKAMYVISKNNKPPSKISGSKISPGNNDRTPLMKFYPESGALITGANSTVAFLIRNAEQIPVVTQGYIKDSRDSIVAHFISNRFGAGKFDLYPSSYRKYKAYINWNGKELSYPLPPFNFYAGQIAVTKQTEGKITLRILLEDSIYKKDIATYVIGVSKDNLCFAGIGRGSYELEVAEQKFPKGIATFYLFDTNFKFLSERSVYINENLFVNASIDKKMYGKRDKVNLSVSINDAAGHPVPSLFSVAVTDSVFSNPADECMVPDLNDPGSINNIFLIRTDCFSTEDLDLFMRLKNNTSPRNHPVNNTPSDDHDNLFFIKGKALDEKNNPLANKILTLFSNSGKDIFISDTTNNFGRFSFPVSNYMDSTQFAIEAKDINGKSIKIKIIKDPIIFPHFSTPAYLKKYPSDTVFTTKYRNAYLDTAFTGTAKRLPAVIIKGKKEVNYNESKRVSTSSTIITSDQLDERQAVGNTILNVGGLHILNGFLVINGLTAMQAPNAGSEPLLLIDGVQAPNAGDKDKSPVMETLNSINPKEIEFIEILKGAEGANYGVKGGNGVILVNMATRPWEKFAATGNNLQTFYAKGIYRSSLFPAINYDNKETRSSENFDNRSTIFWDGSILSVNTDHLNVSFFTNDIPTTYKIIIRGVTVHGNSIYKSLTFQSK